MKFLTLVKLLLIPFLPKITSGNNALDQEALHVVKRCDIIQRGERINCVGDLLKCGQISNQSIIASLRYSFYDCNGNCTGAGICATWHMTQGKIYLPQHTPTMNESVDIFIGKRKILRIDIANRAFHQDSLPTSHQLDNIRGQRLHLHSDLE